MKTKITEYFEKNKLRNMRIFEPKITEYLEKNKIINIRIMDIHHPYITKGVIWINYMAPENNYIFKKIIESNKYISMDFDLDTIFINNYKTINNYIISYTNEIIIQENFNNEMLDSIIDKSINLQKLVMYSNNLDTEIINKLSERQFLKHIKIICKKNININNIYKIIEIKSLNILRLQDFFCVTPKLGLEKLLKILNYVVNNLNKYIEIVVVVSNYYSNNEKFERDFSLIKHNFKFIKKYYTLTYIFNYIPISFRKFNNLHDLDLFYQ